MARQLGGEDDQFLSYRTAEYKLHYFETPSQLKLVMLTDTRVGNMRTVLYQIWATLYVEYVVKSPIAPTEHPRGVGVANELFEGGLETFIVRLLNLLQEGEMLTDVLRPPSSHRSSLESGESDPSDTTSLGYMIQTPRA
jgi:trafficking protein particle complex subunit 1